MRGARRDLLVLALFSLVAAVYARPIFGHFGTRLAADAGDPALNAAVLWWNATTVPFTAGWWNQPWFHPAWGVTAFTETLVGLAPIASPAYWLSGNPVTAYNVTFFASWPLSAFAAYLLARRLTGRTDAGILAGLAFGFSPYRASAELSHVQSLSMYWLPVALAALHGYLESRRTRWLGLFAVAWVAQSLTNGYYMLFGGVLIGCWLAYFGTTARAWRAAATAAGVWVAASAVLIPVMLGYHRIHAYYGLRRTLEEARVFSATAESFVEVGGFSRFWSGVLPSGPSPLFPGLTVVVLAGAAAALGLWHGRRRGPSARSRTVLRWGLAVGFVGGLVATAWWLASGPVALQFGHGLSLRMTSPGRALALLAVSGTALLWLSAARAAVRARRPSVFYAAAAALMALFACGPVLQVRGVALLDPAPYRWLMALPGFDQLRAPSRFWMVGVLGLSIAAGLGFAAIARTDWKWRRVLFVVLAAGILADGWLTGLPTAAAPAVWTRMAGAGPSLPLLELPIGPAWDAAATLRATGHGRPVVNGVSGYDPPHYAPLQVGLGAEDPEMLEAIASLGPFDVSIEAANDPGGRWRRYAAAAPGAVFVADGGERTIVRVPGRARPEPSVGAAVPIRSVRASHGDASAVFDHRTDTDWVDASSTGDRWLLADLGPAQPIGGVSLALEEHAADFPRRLAIDVSSDGTRFARVWEGSPAAATFLAALRAPRGGWLRVQVPATEARYVLILNTDWTAGWRVPELEINAPVRTPETR